MSLAEQLPEDLSEENHVSKKYEDRNNISLSISRALFEIYDEDDVDLKKVFENRENHEDDDSDIILIKKLFNISEAFEVENMSIDNAAFIYARYCECIDLNHHDINWNGLDTDHNLYTHKIAWVKRFLSDYFTFKGVRVRNTNIITSLGKVCVYPDDMAIVVRYLNLSFKGTAIVYYPAQSGIFSHVCGQGALNLKRSFVERYIRN